MMYPGVCVPDQSCCTHVIDLHYFLVWVQKTLGSFITCPDTLDDISYHFCPKQIHLTKAVLNKREKEALCWILFWFFWCLCQAPFPDCLQNQIKYPWLMYMQRARPHRQETVSRYIHTWTKVGIGWYLKEWEKLLWNKQVSRKIFVARSVRREMVDLIQVQSPQRNCKSWRCTENFDMTDQEEGDNSWCFLRELWYFRLWLWFFIVREHRMMLQG